MKKLLQVALMVASLSMGGVASAADTVKSEDCNQEQKPGQEAGDCGALWALGSMDATNIALGVLTAGVLIGALDNGSTAATTTVE